MKKVIGVVSGMLLSLALGTAYAGDSQQLLTVTGQTAPMSNTELGEVTGGFADVCFLCALTNNAAVTQLNISSVSALVGQNNTSGVIQSNN